MKCLILAERDGSLGDKFPTMRPSGANMARRLLYLQTVSPPITRTGAVAADSGNGESLLTRVRLQIFIGRRNMREDLLELVSVRVVHFLSPLLLAEVQPYLVSDFLVALSALIVLGFRLSGGDIKGCA